MKIRVFNADDHPILRKGISDLLSETEEIEWVGSASNGRDALEQIRMIRPDVALLDIEMPHLTGLEVARKVLEEGLKTHVVLLTLFKDGDFLNKALAMGVKGYLIKESSEREIIDCIQSVADGTAPSANGPFTITDSYGSTAVTAAGDNVVVSPNVTSGGKSSGITSAQANKMISLLEKVANKSFSVSMDGRKLSNAMETSGVSYNI